MYDVCVRTFMVLSWRCTHYFHGTFMGLPFALQSAFAVGYPLQRVPGIFQVYYPYYPGSAGTRVSGQHSELFTVTTELVSLLGLKNQHGHWLCWMPTGRKNGFK